MGSTAVRIPQHRGTVCRRGPRCPLPSQVAKHPTLAVWVPWVVMVLAVPFLRRRRPRRDIAVSVVQWFAVYSGWYRGLYKNNGWELSNYQLTGTGEED